MESVPTSSSTLRFHLRTASKEERSVVEKATTQAWAPLEGPNQQTRSQFKLPTAMQKFCILVA